MKEYAITAIDETGGDGSRGMAPPALGEEPNLLEW
jgi:hypothetical protein